MKRFAIVCAFVLLLNVLCPVGHMHAEEISTPTDVECEHPRRHEGGYQSDDTHHWYACPDCGEKVDVLEHNDKCYPEGAGVCNDCKRTDVTFGFTGHGYIDMDAYGSDTYTHWNVCEACGEKLNVNYHVGTAGGDCTVCGAPYACAHAYGQYDGDDTYHWFVCDSCGESVNKEVHDAKPGDVGDNCTVCGAYIVCNHTNKSEWHYDAMTHWKECIDCGFVVDELGHDNWANCSVCGYACEHTTLSSWMSNETEHWQECLDCGESVNKETHDAKPGSNCTVCGIYIVCEHTNMSEWRYDAITHWKECIDCGYVVDIMGHDTPWDCSVCGYVCTHEDWSYMKDERFHWQVCQDCGYTFNSSLHYDTCQVANVCGGCGATDVEFALTSCEGLDTETWYSDAYHHWRLCSACGEKDSLSLHYAPCGGAGICITCGADCETSHSYTLDEYGWDAGFHWRVCTNCRTPLDIDYRAHSVTCENESLCTVCGYEQCEVEWPEHDIDYGTWMHDDTHHWTGCSKCDYIVTKLEHHSSCAQPGVCAQCGVTFVDDGEEIQHTVIAGGEYTWDQYQHYEKCIDCGQAVYGDVHNSDCSDPDKCLFCGADGVTVAYVDHWNADSDWSYDDQYHWYYCSDCQGKAWAEPHSRQHGDPEVCNVCGAPYSGDEGHIQDSSVPHNETTHESQCAECGEIYKDMSIRGVLTAPTCTEDGLASYMCDLCWSEVKVPIPATGHTWGDPVTVAATCASAGSKTATCTTCGEKTVETIPATGKHTWGEPVTVDPTCVGAGSKTTACTACGEKTVETIPASGEHSWETVSKIYATCTKAGRTERVCTVCDELSITTQGAKGHAYGLVFITQGNGTHAKTCADCGAKHVEDCILTSTEMGDMVCSACATCGYAVYTMTDVALEEVEGLNDATAEIEVKLVENVSFELVAEPAEEGAETEAEAAEITDVVLVVHETQLEMTVELPDTVNASVKKVLAVSMLKEGSAIQPTGKVKLSIPVVEEEVTGMKLVLMSEDGELVEIEYEIIDGVIVFETDMVGIFLFVEAEA